MIRWFTYRSALLLSLSVLLIGCGAQTPVSPSLAAVTPSTSSVGPGFTILAARPASRCANVSLEGVANLGLVNGSLGALPFEATIGGVRGLMSSYITGANPSGSAGQGAAHYTLQHTFISTDATRPGSFATADRAVCAVAGSDPNVCRVNDVLQIVRGDGVFANPEGFLTNHGTIDLNTWTLTVDLGGRVCGDGL